MTRRSKNKENENPEGIKKSSTAHNSETGIKIKINNENQTHRSKNKENESMKKSSKGRLISDWLVGV